MIRENADRIDRPVAAAMGRTGVVAASALVGVVAWALLAGMIALMNADVVNDATAHHAGQFAASYALNFGGTIGAVVGAIIATWQSGGGGFAGRITAGVLVLFFFRGNESEMRGARIMLRLAGATSGVLVMGAAFTGVATAQPLFVEVVPTRSESAKGRTCTQLRDECDHHGFIVEEKPAVQAARCARYWDFCVKTGVYHDGKRTITGVIRE